METDSAPLSRAFLEKISDTYGVSADWLLTGHGEMLRTPGEAIAPRAIATATETHDQQNQAGVAVDGKDYVWIKRMGLSVSAGHGIAELPELESDGIFLPGRWLNILGHKAEALVMVNVRGDSMAPVIPDGAMVMIDLRARALRKPGIFAFNLYGQSYVKRIIPSGKDRLGRPRALMLASDNPAFPPVVLTGTEMNDLQLVGRVVAVLNLLKE